MPKASPLQSSFNAGEFSPRLLGRVEIDRYKQALKLCLNYIPTVQGALVRRPGTYFVAEVKDSTKATRLVRFEFNKTQAYILEFGDQYIRFYRDYGQIESGGSPYEISSPYLEADLFELDFNQNADTLFITHPSYAPRTLTRTGHTSWTLSTITFLDGPYLAENTSATTLTCSGVSGSVTVTASAPLFASTDVGRHIRLYVGAWTWLKITAYTSTTQVTATIMGVNADTSAHTRWRLGIWSDTTGYPAVSVFHEDRLTYAGSNASPQRIDMSYIGDYYNFAPSESGGTITASHAVSFALNSNDVNIIRWLVSEERALLAGTAAGEWSIRPSVQSEPISASNIPNAKQSSAFGSASVQPVYASKAAIYVTRTAKKVRELSYDYQVDGFRSLDRTLLADHITGSTGIKQMAYQREPQPIIWAVRNDGVLASMVYESEDDSLIVGWARHILGGVSNAASSDAVVESVASIPSPDATRDDVWLIVRRWINGASQRYVEYMKPFFSDEDEQKDAFFVDCGLTYDSPKTITGVTQASPGVVTSAAHGFSNGDYVLISDLVGMGTLNGDTFVVRNATVNTFTLEDMNGTAVNTTSYAAYVSGGEVRKYVTNISGLDHLEGQTVAILGDGGVQPSKTVSSGAITLDTRATTVHIGLSMVARGTQLRQEAGSADGTAVGKTRRTHRVAFMLHRTLGLKIGRDFDNLDELVFRTNADEDGRAPELFTGIKAETIDMDSDYDNYVCWEQSDPLPGTILAIGPQLHTEDAA